MDTFELLKRLNAAHGPSGDEGQIRQVIQQLVKPFADEMTTDTMGNLIVHKRGAGPKLMFSAHMDSIGFIVTHITKEGYLRCGRLGGVSPKETVNTAVRFKNGVRGVFVKEEKADFAKLKLDECFIDIGAKDQAEAQKMVRIGDTAVYDTPMFCNSGKVISPYLDNRIACVILLRALEQLTACENDCTFVFSVQEEVGLRGAKTASYAVDPDYGIAVDVTDVDDVPGSEQYGTTQLGKGAAVKVMDNSVICHPKLVEKMEQVANARNITVQRDILRAGGTDAGVMSVNRCGVVTGGISIPCRYIHTPCEMADLSDVDACVALVIALAQTKLETFQ